MKLLAKRAIILSLFSVTSLSATDINAQNTQEKAPLYRPVAKTSVDSSKIIEERLVALALQGPRYEVTIHENKVKEYQLRAAKNNLLNLIALSTTINDQTFSKQSSTTAPALYPKISSGINIPLGTILSRTEVKAAREQIKMGNNTQELLRRTIRKEVLTKYLQYKAVTAQIVNLTLLIDDETANAGQIDQQFKDGKISFEEYGAISKASSTNTNERIMLELQRDTYKLDLEELIGVPLEDVLSGKIKPEINN